MKNKDTRINKLLKYSALSSLFLIIRQTTDAQVIYTDIEPDTVLDERTETFEVDIDQNGNIDFVFINSSWTYYKYAWSTYVTVQDLLVGPYTSQNAIAGKSVTFSSFTVYFPNALEKYSEIGNNLSWQTWGIQFMGLKRIFGSGEYYFPCFECYWYGFEIPETLDHYLGIRFKDDLNRDHYGWIRCDVKDEGRTLIIKDYAYELQPDNPILAGDTLHYDATQDSIGEEGIYLYSFNKTIYINLTEEFGEYFTITVYNVSGKEIGKVASEKTHIEITVEAPAGMYLVKVKSEDKLFAKKVFLK